MSIDAGQGRPLVGNYAFVEREASRMSSFILAIKAAATCSPPHEPRSRHGFNSLYSPSLVRNICPYSDSIPAHHDPLNSESLDCNPRHINRAVARVRCLKKSEVMEGRGVDSPRGPWMDVRSFSCDPMGGFEFAPADFELPELGAAFEDPPAPIPLAGASAPQEEEPSGGRARGPGAKKQPCRSNKLPSRTQSQRQNHILAERQRREEMNEKFSILRTILPKLTKKDKASIVTDTINYVKELEKMVRHLQACKSRILSQRVSFGEDDAEGIGIDPATCDIKDIRICAPQVEVQSLGSRAIIKLICSRSPGLVLRTYKALDECKVDVLQSNVTTLGSNSVHYFTVQVNPGVSASEDELISTLQQATATAWN